MRKIILLIFLLLLMAVPGWGGTYYVSITGHNIAPYTSEEMAANEINTILTYIKNHAYSSNIINISTGTYMGSGNYMVLDHPSYANLVIRGAGRGQTIIDSGEMAIYASNSSVDNISISNLTLRVSAFNKQAIMVAAGCDNWTIEDVDILSCGLHNHHLATFSGTDGLICSRVRFLGCHGVDKYPLVLNGNTSGSINHSIFTSNGTGLIDFVSVNSTGSLLFKNCIFDNHRSHGIYKQNTGALTVDTCALDGGVANAATYPIWNNGSGVVTINNCNIMANPWDGDAKWIYGTATESENIKTNDNLYFTSYRGGYIVPCIDDAGDFSYAQSVANLLAAHDMSGTFYIEQCGWESANNDKLVAMNSAGIMELGIHSWSHINLTYNHALAIDYNGSDSNPTCTFDGSTISLATNEGNDDAMIDVTTSGTDTLAEIIAAVPANWAIGYSTTDGQVEGNFHTGMQRATSLKAMSGTAVPCNIDFLRTTYSEGLLYDEITAPKEWLESILGETVYSFGYPYNAGDSTSRAATISAGFSNARYNASSSSIGLLTDVDLHALYVITNQLIGADEEATRQNARALAYATQQSGLITFFLGHNENQVSLEEWGWILDEWAKFDGVKVCSAKTAAHEIISGGDYCYDGDRGRYSRVYPVSDYSITDASPRNIPSIQGLESISLPFAAPILTVATEGTFVNLSWTSVGNVDGYTLYYAPYPDANYIGNIDMGMQTTIAGELQNGDSYYVAIQAYNGVGNSNFSNIGYFIIKPDRNM